MKIYVLHASLMPFVFQLQANLPIRPGSDKNMISFTLLENYDHLSHILADLFLEVFLCWAGLYLLVVMQN